MNVALESVLMQASPAYSRVRFGGALLLATISHLGLGVSASSSRRPAVPQLAHETEIQALPIEPPPPPLLPPPSPQAPEPAMARAAAPTPTTPRVAAPPPAAAANVRSAPEDAPLDLTGGMVMGTAEQFAGGVVAASSTGARVGSAAGTTPSATRTGVSLLAPPHGPDLARPARLADGVSWNCPFPAEADEAGIDAAVVGLSVEVATTGEVVSVKVEQDPGTGFGRVAAACARSKRFSPAQDREGRPVAGRSRVNVRFQR